MAFTSLMITCPKRSLRWLAFASCLLGCPALQASEPVTPKLHPAEQSVHAQHAEMLGGARAGARLVAVGQHGIVLLSDDEGRSWRQARQVPADATLTSVSFVDAHQGWAVGHRGLILHTQDGGDTWTVQRDDAREDRPLFAVHFFDAQRGVAVGLWSLVLRTQDGGQSWKPQTLGAQPGGRQRADANLYGLFADDQGGLYVAAEKGLLLHSADQGATWRYLNTGYTGSFWTGLAVPGGVLLAGGLRGSLYRSADAGLSWARVKNEGGGSIAAMARNPAGRLAAVGLDGRVLVSDDAGASFTVAAQGNGESLTAVLPGGQRGFVLLSRKGPLALDDVHR